MRLPDGAPDGSGFPQNKSESLAKLCAGSIPTISAVDGSTTYNGWQDLCDTIQTVIQQESVGIPTTWINYPNPDTTVNAGDHSDHLAVGQAVQQMSILSTLNQAKFVDYNLINYPADLTGEDLFWKVAMFAAYEKAMFDASGHSTINEDPSYVQWCLISAHFV
jgi:hypothetical protein